MQLRKTFICAMILLFSYSSFASNEVGPILEIKIELASSQVKALMVAYSDFENKISVQSEGPPELIAHVSGIDNYAVTVSEDVAHYIIMFAPNPFQGQMLKGGGARYLINKVSFQVKEVVRFK